MLLWLALVVVCANAQLYLDLSTSSPGLCENAAQNASPPNYSKNDVSPLSCRAQCSSDDMCVGYSTAAELPNGVTNRCAIWIDRALAKNPPTGYTAHNYVEGWVQNVSKLDRGSGDAEWTCFVRIDDCPAGFLVAGGVTLQYGEINQGQFVLLQCSDFDASTIGEVRIECQSGRAVKQGEGTCVPLAIPSFTELGTGVCRDTTPHGTYIKSVGPGVSPPNFSKEGLSLAECKEHCIGNIGIPLICIGISYGGPSTKRCSLFINTPISHCGSKNGWEKHDYDYGWTVPHSVIDATSDEAGWKCYKRDNAPEPDLEALGITDPVTVDRTVTYQMMAGTGVCADANDNSPANYSKSKETQTECMSECTGLDGSNGIKCLGFAHNLNGDSRCALYTNTVVNAVSLGGWTSHVGEPGWNPKTSSIVKADQVGGGWLCFKKLETRRRKN